MSMARRRKPVVVKPMTFAEVLAEGKRRAEEGEARVAAMTPEQLEAYKVEQAKKNKEVEKILQQLRGPGFMEVSLTLKQRRKK